MACLCHIIPSDVLDRLSRDPRLPAEDRRRLALDAVLSRSIRRLRAEAAEHTRLVSSFAFPPVALPVAAAVAVGDCHHTMNLPGTPVADPAGSADAAAKGAAVEAKGVHDFYQTVFGRNSIDDGGMAILSSVHYGQSYNNAFWNGSQMAYGDGDGKLFVDFTRGNDVIGHELTHGVTQHSLQLAYTNQAGGLNESMSDVFGSMYRQWRGKQDVRHADWLIGKEIMGPTALAHGYTCLRDMAHPGAAHCLAPQPHLFSQYHDGMDPHESSGIANHAFYRAARAVGGRSWEKTGQVWYKALTTSGSHPTMKMKDFAHITRTIAHGAFASDPHVFAGVDGGWKAVGL